MDKPMQTAQAQKQSTQAQAQARAQSAQTLDGYLDSPKYVADRERMRQRYLLLDGEMPGDETLRAELIKDFLIALEFGEIIKESDKYLEQKFDAEVKNVQDYH
jgi:hypothetical protein